MVAILKTLIRDDQGQDMIEYGILAALLSIVALATIKLLAAPIQALYEKIKVALS